MDALWNKHTQRVLQDLLELGADERRWALQTALGGVAAADGHRIIEVVLHGMTEDDRCKVIEMAAHGASDAMMEKVRRIFEKGPEDEPPKLYKHARNMLLDATDLSAAEQVLLAASAVCELYELAEFNSSQINVLIKETGNDTGNISMAMKGMVQKGWAEVVAKDGDSQQARNRYRITSSGTKRTHELLDDTSARKPFKPAVGGAA